MSGEVACAHRAEFQVGGQTAASPPELLGAPCSAETVPVHFAGTGLGQGPPSAGMRAGPQNNCVSHLRLKTSSGRGSGQRGSAVKPLELVQVLCVSPGGLRFMSTLGDMLGLCFHGASVGHGSYMTWAIWDGPAHSWTLPLSLSSWKIPDTG